MLVGGAGPHQGNVMVNSPDGGYGAILSCSDDYAYCSAGQGVAQKLRFPVFRSVHFQYMWPWSQKISMFNV